MARAQARIQRAVMADRSVRRILVIDEGWAVLSNLAVARWMQFSNARSQINRGSLPCRQQTHTQ
jgi:hypothetical protein